jgi:hypothetical protein
MNSAAEDIKDMLEYYLGESGTELELNSDFSLFEISVGREPDEPIEMISIFQTVGFPPQLTLNRSEVYESPSVQLRVRAYNYLKGYDQAQVIKDTLHGRANETWNDSEYTLIQCQNGPHLLDFDKNQRPRFIINFNLQRR